MKLFTYVTFQKQIEQLLQEGRYVSKCLSEEWGSQDAHIPAKLGSGLCHHLTRGTWLVVSVAASEMVRLLTSWG